MSLITEKEFSKITTQFMIKPHTGGKLYFPYLFATTNTSQG